jgi:signal transduction histidine kinase
MPGRESSKTHFQLDWLISNLRWLLLVGVALVIFLDVFVRHTNLREVTSLIPQIVILVLAVLYNIAVIFLLSYESPSQVLPIVTLVIDTLLTIGLIISSGGLRSPLLFFALFPILTAALRFSQTTSLLIALGVIVSFGGAVFLISPPTAWTDLLPFAVFALVLLVASVISSFVSEEVKKIVARKREETRENGREDREVDAARKHSRLTFELASTLSATLNYSKVLRAALEVAEKGMRELGQKDASQVAAVLLFTHSDLRVASSRHLSPRDRGVSFQGNEGAIGEALRSAEPVVVVDPVEDEALGKLISMHGCEQAIVVPLRAGFENFGVVIFGSSKTDLYNKDLENLLVAICNQAIVALQNAQLYQDLRQEKERIVAVEEDARKKLARNLHDGPTQSIASIAMQVNYVRQLIENEGNPNQVSEELEKVEDLARETTKQIRHMLFTLRPLILETQGLQAALEQYISKLDETNGMKISLDVDPRAAKALSKEAEGRVFYIIEEAISNARKHSEADNIWVSLKLQDEAAFVAEVEDDGTGFDIDAIQMTYDRRGSLGLVNMHERAEMTDGALSISSAPGEGTRVRLTIPLGGAW